MYALVKYTDNIYYVCNSKYVTRKKGETKVTYKDGRKYSANVIVKHGKSKHFIFSVFAFRYYNKLHIIFYIILDNKILLEDAKRNIVIGKPRVLLDKPLEILNIENNSKLFISLDVQSKILRARKNQAYRSLFSQT